jgi:peptidoglycan/xylan/chitin deacetylase (PgdA/CDA1 family)
VSLASLARPAWRVVTRPVGTVRAVATGAPHIVLTYDDGPDPAATPAVLEMLAKHGATATFFVLMTRARKYPSLLREVLDAGHEIGLHGVDHTRLTTLPLAEVRRRCRAGKAELQELTGQRVRWFRAPYGALMPPHWAVVRAAGMMPVAWGPTPGDWRELPEAELAAQAVDQSHPGGIMLAHDGFAVAEDNAFDGPAPAIDRGKLADLMLTGLSARGMAARSLGQSLRSGRARRWAWFIR